VNESKLERRLRLLFDNCEVRFGPVKGGVGQTTMDAGKVVVTLPTGYDDDYTLRVLIHELTHHAMPGELAAWGAFEEDILNRVVEPRMMFWITERARTHQWWVKRLNQAKEEA